MPQNNISVIYYINKSFNKKLLHQSFESIFNQNDYQNEKIYVIDTESKREIKKLINNYQNIKYYQEYSDEIINEIDSEYVIYMSSNDILDPNTITVLNEINNIYNKIDIFMIPTEYIGVRRDKKINYNEFPDKSEPVITGEELSKMPISLNGSILKNEGRIFKNITDLWKFMTEDSKIIMIGTSKLNYYEYVSETTQDRELPNIEYGQLDKFKKSKENWKNYLPELISIDNQVLHKRVYLDKYKNNNIFNEIFNKTYFKISVVMAVYNVENYLTEAIESLVSQSIGFDNIQLILIDDGSTDDSNLICEYYEAKYPRNIVYRRIDNSGVSYARNLGLSFVKGEIVNFLDSDDKLGATTLKNIYQFMKNNKEVDVSSIRLQLFDGAAGGHPLNYKYDKKISRISDLSHEYWNVQLNVSSAFFRIHALSNLLFDTELKYGEDTKFVNAILKKNPKIGLISHLEGCYWYRKRQDNSSAMQNTTKEKNWYLPTLTNSQKKILNKDSMSNKFCQYTVMYDFQWRMKINPRDFGLLSDVEIQQYEKGIYELLGMIDSDVLSNKNITAISPSYKEILLERFTEEKYNVLIKEKKVMLNIVEHKNGILHLGISVPGVKKDKDQFKLVHKGTEILPNEIHVDKKEYLLDELLVANEFYEYYIPMKKYVGDKLTMKYVSNDVEIPIKSVQGKFSHLANTRKPYQYKDCFYIEYDKKSEFKIEDNKRGKVVNKNRVKKMLKNPKHKEIAKNRILAMIMKKRLANKKVWIIGDRVDASQDNGEALYRYLLENPLQDVKPYFVIDKDARDYQRLSKEFEILEYGSKKYNLMMLVCDKLILSQADDHMLRPFGDKYDFYKDILSFDLVFLQHGVIGTNLSNWLVKTNKNIKLFITTSENESDSIVNSYPYFYSSNQVSITGLARYDLLEEKKTSIITIMPTWRKELVEQKQKNKNFEFKKSNYFIFYNKLLNSPELLQVLKNNNIKLKFAQHPNMRLLFNNNFSGNDFIEVVNEVSYSKLLSESQLLITDISSLFFDFSYMGKPLIYTHFDFEDLMNKSTYKVGYFNYETDGFGPVVKTVEETVNKIINYIEKGFAVEEEYQEKTSGFFMYQDKDNRKRIINEIGKIDEKYSI